MDRGDVSTRAEGNDSAVYVIDPQLITLLFITGHNAVPWPSVGHSHLCVDPLHQPLQSEGSAAVWLWWRIQSPTETGWTFGSVQEQSVSVLGVSANVSRDADSGSEVGTSPIGVTEGGVVCSLRSNPLDCFDHNHLTSYLPTQFPNIDTENWNK